MSDKLVDAIANMKEEEALGLAREIYEGGEDPLKILDACREAMEIVGKRFEVGEYFLPELIMAGEMLKEIAEIVKPGLQKEEGKKDSLGKVLIATVEGDLHDIGKDIVTFMLEVNKFEVRDLGIDVPAQKIVDEVKDFQPQVVGLSGFLTLAFDAMKNTVEALEAAGLRNNLKVMIGGGQVDDNIREYTGADAYGTDAMAAVALSRKWIEETV
ncbi:B12-binding domain-containing protein [Thermodesulfobacteriota bacterium]